MDHPEDADLQRPDRVDAAGPPSTSSTTRSNSQCSNGWQAMRMSMC